jgi:hypothetical protein
MLNFYRPFFIPCFGSHFENGRHLENLENSFQICGKAGQSHIFGGSKGVGVTIESYKKRSKNNKSPKLCLGDLIRNGAKTI